MALYDKCFEIRLDFLTGAKSMPLALSRDFFCCFHLLASSFGVQAEHNWLFQPAQIRILYGPRASYLVHVIKAIAPTTLFLTNEAYIQGSPVDVLQTETCYIV